MIGGTPNDLRASDIRGAWLNREDFAAFNTHFFASKMLTLAGQILLPTEQNTAQILPGVVQIDSGQIQTVDLGNSADSFQAMAVGADFADENALISPGFLDAHLHLPQFDSIGASGMPLLDWLHAVIFPAEAKWNQLEYAQAMITRVIRQCLSVGTTGICAYSTVDHRATVAALNAFRETGFRGVIGQSIMDRNAPQELLRSADQQIDELSRMLDEFPPGDRLSTAITPRFAPACTEDLLTRAGELARARGSKIQTHLSETRRECEMVSDLFDGQSYVEVYESFGLVTPESIFGHGIYLSEDEQQLLADHGSMIAHCPTANSFLGSGTMDRTSHLNAGINLVLGSDVGAGYERSMVRVGRAMIDAAMRLAFAGCDVTVPTATEAWYQITAGNAESLGWSDVGRIEQGNSADLLLILPDIPWRETRCPLSTLMFAWDDRWIKQTYLRGEPKYESGLGPHP